MNGHDDVTRLREMLGPGFNYSALAQMIPHLPKDMQEAAKELVSFDLRRQQLDPDTAFGTNMQPRVGAPEAPTSMFMRGLGMMGNAFMGLQQGITGVPTVQKLTEAVAQSPGARMLGRGAMDIASNLQYLNPAVAMSSAALANAPGPMKPLVQAQLHDDFVAGRGAQVMQEFSHQLTMGLMDAPLVAVNELEAWNNVVKPVTMIAAMATQGGGIIRTLGYASKMPKIAPMLERLPQRMKDVGIGVVTMGAVDAMRAEGLPEHPSMLDPAGYIGHQLASIGVPERLALGIGGAGLGGLMSGTLLGVGRGLGLLRERKFTAAIADKPKLQEAVRAALLRNGVTIPEAAQPRDLARLFRQMKKPMLDEDLAGMVGERHAYEEYIIQEIYGGATIAPASEQGRLLAGIFRTNTGGTSVVTGITDIAAVQEASKRLGIQLQFQHIRRGTQTGAAPVYDVLMSRPNYEYPTIAQTDRRSKAIGARLVKLSESKAKDQAQTLSKEIYLTSDAELVRGGFTVPELEQRIKLKKPVINGVERGDLALRVQGQVVRMELQEGNKILVELPTRLSQEQFNALGNMFSARRFAEVTLSEVSGKTHILTNPLGPHIQDVIASVIKPTKTSSKITQKMVQQYKAQGVFEGQAAVLSTGLPARVNRKAGLFYEITDPLTNEVRRVHPDRLTLLPTTLDGEMSPSFLFASHLDEAERAKLAQLHQGINKGLAEPIKTFRELEEFASTHGFFARSLKGGAVELTHGVTGEALPQFTNKAAAVRYVQKAIGPVPELTPPEITKLLGNDVRLGAIGGGGAPPHFGELLPLDEARILTEMDKIQPNVHPTWWQRNIQPTLRAIENIDAKLGTKMSPVFRHLQSQKVAEINWTARWYAGKGEALPKDVVPLQRIIQTGGGRNGDWERVTAWLETPRGTPEEAKLLSEMTPGERTAAPQLRKWYDELFKELGIEADYLENYVPHWRQLGATHGNQPAEIWKATGGDPLNLPKGLQFFADQYREGTLDIYELNAIRAASAYLRQGAHNRFMKDAYNSTKRIVGELRKHGRGAESAAEVLGRATLAMRGMENGLENAAMQEMVKGILDKLPGSAPNELTANMAEKIANGLLGAVYTSAMGMRLSLAMRNAFAIFYMNYPIYGGGSKTKFLESIGKALTKTGRDEAVAARAVALKSTARSMTEIGDNVLGVSGLEHIMDQTMWMYDTADELARTASFHSAGDRTREALTEFAHKVAGKTDDQIETLKRKLVGDTGLWLQKDDVIEEFWRRAAHNTDDAANFAGKMASDVTQFLYGRGMQGHLMRSIPGRFLGQFGSWSLWYIDFLRRIASRGLMRDGRYRVPAIKALLRHGMVNAGIIVAGREVLNINLDRWVSYPALFYSGGPGFELVKGTSTLFRGVGETIGFDDNPFAQSRVTEGQRVITNTLRSFVPLYSAGREAIRLAEGPTATDRIAALFGTKPTREWDYNRRWELMFGPPQPFVSDSVELEDTLNDMAAGGANTVDISQISQQQISPEQMMQQAQQPQQQAPTQMPQQPPPAATVPPTVPQGIMYPQGLESVKPAEAPPISNY